MIGVVIYAGVSDSRALRELVNSLPRDFDAAVFVVGSYNAGDLIPSLQSATRLSMFSGTRAHPLEPGRLYAAPPGFQMRINPPDVEFIRGNVSGSTTKLVESAYQTFGRWMVGVVVDAVDVVSQSLSASIKDAGGYVLSNASRLAHDDRAPEMSRLGRNVVAVVEDMRNRLPPSSSALYRSAPGRRH